jgi:hypothetical protein
VVETNFQERKEKRRGKSMMEHSMFSRLEDFISLARKGEDVGLTITLNKQILTRKFEPYTAGDSEDEVDMYIFSADYFFLFKGKTYEVTKLYAFGVEGEPLDITKHNITVADERLKMDYKRLRDADIAFEEKFWHDQLWGRF